MNDKNDKFHSKIIKTKPNTLTSYSIFQTKNAQLYFDTNFVEFVYKTGSSSNEFTLNMKDDEDSKDITITNGKYFNSMHTFLIKSKKYSKKLLDLVNSNGNNYSRENSNNNITLSNNLTSIS